MSSKRIEDVLLQIPEVRYKKSDGTLYIMKERIVFMCNGDKVSLSHGFQDIKSKLRNNFMKIKIIYK